MKTRQTNGEERGFSLIELLVVLAILAALTTVALRSVSGVQGQAKYLQTTSSLNGIRDAIIGPANLHGPDGSALVTGFVADVGRLPVYQVSASDPLGVNGDPLNELLSPNTIPIYGLATSAFDPGVQLFAGWQGPYVRIGAGPTFLRDGWGHSFHVYDNNGNLGTSAGATPIAQISSWGLDNVADTNHGGTGDTNGYDADISIPNPASVASGSFTYSGQLYGRVAMNWGLNNPSSGSPTPSSSGGPAPNADDVNQPISVWVGFYGPNCTGPSPAVSQYFVEVFDSSATPPTGAPTYATALANGFAFTIPAGAATIGPRLLRAYVLPGGTTNLNNVSTFNLAQAPTGSSLALSPILPVTVVGGGQTIPSLVLPFYSQD